MMTVYNLVVTYLLFVVAIIWFDVIVYIYYYEEQLAEEEDEDIELGNDNHCCGLCHEDVKAFSEILRLSKCEHIRSRFSQLKKDLTYNFLINATF